MNAIQTTIKGNVTHDPQYREFEDGGRLSTFSVAVNDGYFDQNAESWKERKTEFVKVQIRKAALANHVLKSIRKGTPVMARGRLAPATWEDRSGVQRYDLILHADSVAVDLSYGTVEYTKTANRMCDPVTGEIKDLTKAEQTLQSHEQEMREMDAAEGGTVDGEDALESTSDFPQWNQAKVAAAA